MPEIHRALISVSDKRGLLEFARALRDMNVTIISTGGTASALREAGIQVLMVSDVTGFPEILDGRVKTLHPKIHAALLAVPDRTDHVRQLHELAIEPIDMVVVNLYPFEETVRRPDVRIEEALEQIDIGGPSMLRSASKNFRYKAVLSDPAQYPEVISEMKASGGNLSEETCARLAAAVFSRTSCYDQQIASYLQTSEAASDAPPAMLNIAATKEMDLRYGENPHQHAALYGNFSSVFRKLHGKELSYNNIVDLSAAALLVEEFTEPTVAIIKHTNPCGVGTASTLADAYAKALATDNVSAFGGVIAVNRPLDMAAAERMSEIFVELIVAPEVPADVLEYLRRKKDRRIVERRAALRQGPQRDIRTVPGGYLLQESDPIGTGGEQFRVVSKRSPSPAEIEALRFAWTVAKHVKSNAIVYALSDRTLGVGAGQMSRVDSARIAAEKAQKAGLDLRGSAVASDAYFPFADGLLEAVRAGATAAVEPGGSVRDGEVIKAADDNAIAMVFTGIRHFRH
ncbi:MAG TPA: bifunctional phosphoribosylaminoimidazolecarboxamide formyltransferase/IMP cyclohydrolase [Bacteroidota bacterium]|nr:bifunctional phosphoribosylaminoimidazolecarboxamide formyltransferase/IMP cyclohydrolase [Bacteroidota bacterium]